ncbi:hypothetical protein V5O48_012407 [Marasmius crinis-equi]|uniref:Uncharacterized protein n=1 Tax=Marasmius crinis-equi TaxID=585013 RepID=A0ABR3F2W4_9AGAR
MTPSLANFSFNYIGKEPDLLKRLSAPGSSFQYEEADTESRDQNSPQDSLRSPDHRNSWDAGPSDEPRTGGRPTLLQALSRGEPNLDNDASAMEVDQLVPSNAERNLPPFRTLPLVDTTNGPPRNDQETTRKKSNGTGPPPTSSPLPSGTTNGRPSSQPHPAPSDPTAAISNPSSEVSVGPASASSFAQLPRVEIPQPIRGSAPPSAMEDNDSPYNLQYPDYHPSSRSVSPVKSSHQHQHQNPNSDTPMPTPVHRSPPVDNQITSERPDPPAVSDTTTQLRSLHTRLLSGSSIAGGSDSGPSSASSSSDSHSLLTILTNVMNLIAHAETLAQTSLDTARTSMQAARDSHETARASFDAVSRAKGRVEELAGAVRRREEGVKETLDQLGVWIGERERERDLRRARKRSDRTAEGDGEEGAGKDGDVRMDDDDDGGVDDDEEELNEGGGDEETFRAREDKRLQRLRDQEALARQKRADAEKSTAEARELREKLRREREETERKKRAIEAERQRKEEEERQRRLAEEREKERKRAEEEEVARQARIEQLQKTLAEEQAKLEEARKRREEERKRQEDEERKRQEEERKRKEEEQRKREEEEEERKKKAAEVERQRQLAEEQERERQEALAEQERKREIEEQTRTAEKRAAQERERKKAVDAERLRQIQAARIRVQEEADRQINEKKEKDLEEERQLREKLKLRRDAQRQSSEEKQPLSRHQSVELKVERGGSAGIPPASPITQKQPTLPPAVPIKKSDSMSPSHTPALLSSQAVPKTSPVSPTIPTLASIPPSLPKKPISSTANAIASQTLVPIDNKSTKAEKKRSKQEKQNAANQPTSGGVLQGGPPSSASSNASLSPDTARAAAYGLRPHNAVSPTLPKRPDTVTGTNGKGKAKQALHINTDSNVLDGTQPFQRQASTSASSSAHSDAPTIHSYDSANQGNMAIQLKSEYSPLLPDAQAMNLRHVLGGGGGAQATGSSEVSGNDQIQTGASHSQNSVSQANPPSRSSRTPSGAGGRHEQHAQGQIPGPPEPLGTSPVAPPSTIRAPSPSAFGGPAPSTFPERRGPSPSRFPGARDMPPTSPDLGDGGWSNVANRAREEQHSAARQASPQANSPLPLPPRSRTPPARNGASSPIGRASGSQARPQQVAGRKRARVDDDDSTPRRGGRPPEGRPRDRYIPGRPHDDDDDDYYRRDNVYPPRPRGEDSYYSGSNTRPDTRRMRPTSARGRAPSPRLSPPSPPPPVASRAQPRRDDRGVPPPSASSLERRLMPQPPGHHGQGRQTVHHLPPNPNVHTSPPPPYSPHGYGETDSTHTGHEDTPALLNRIFPVDDAQAVPRRARTARRYPQTPLAHRITSESRGGSPPPRSLMNRLG